MGFWSDKTVLVTGGAGFIGSHTVEALLRRGARVRTTVHQRALPCAWSGVQAVRADLVRPADALSACRGADVVIHAAGAVGAVSVGRLGMMAGMNVNLAVTSQVLWAAWSARVPRFVLFGSSTEYPAMDRPVREDDLWSGPPHPSYFGYGWMRRYLELLGEFTASESGMHLVQVRPTAVYGPRDNFNPASCHVIPALIRRVLSGEDPLVVWGSGNEVRDFLHVEDLVEGTLLAAEHMPSCDPVNIGCGHGVTIAGVVHSLLRCCGRSGTRVVFDASRPAGIPFRMVDISKARERLGFEPRWSFDAGLADTVAWFRGVGQVHEMPAQEGVQL